MHDKFIKILARFGERRARQKPRKLGNHGGFGKVARPHPQVSSIGHATSIIAGFDLWRRERQAEPGRSGVRVFGFIGGIVRELAQAFFQRVAQALKHL